MIKRNKFILGFVRNLKVSASNLQLWLMKVYRYLSQKKFTSLIPSSLPAIQWHPANLKLIARN